MELRSISRLLDHVNIQLCQRLEQHARSLGYRTEAEESWFHNALGDYYRARLTGGEILSPRDRRLIMYLCAIAPEDYPILEFCAGAGQLSAALLALGFVNVTPCEINPHRASLWNIIKPHTNDPPALVADFRSLSLHRYRYIVGVNCVSGNVSPESDAAVFARAIDAGSHVILNPSLYGVEDHDGLLRGLEKYNSIHFESMSHWFPWSR